MLRELDMQSLGGLFVPRPETSRTDTSARATNSKRVTKPPWWLLCPCTGLSPPSVGLPCLGMSQGWLAAPLCPSRPRRTGRPLGVKHRPRLVRSCLNLWLAPSSTRVKSWAGTPFCWKQELDGVSRLGLCLGPTGSAVAQRHIVVHLSFV